METPSSRIKQLESEINELKDSLKKPHLTKDLEGDYEIKSRIIDKQNEMIKLLTEQANKVNRQ
jgi:hypothetical protein